VETKEQFINGVMTRKQVVKSLAFPELKVAVVGAWKLLARQGFRLLA
jgi:hypothetical protein